MAQRSEVTHFGGDRQHTIKCDVVHVCFSCLSRSRLTWCKPLFLLLRVCCNFPPLLTIFMTRADQLICLMNIISELLQKKWLCTAVLRMGSPFPSGRRQTHRHYRGRLAWTFGGACVSVFETALVVGALAATTPPGSILLVHAIFPS